MPKASAATAETSDAAVMPAKEVSVQHYEMLALLPGSSTEQDVETTSQELNDFLVSQQCEITLTQNLGRKSLGYTVMGSRNGTYVLYEFNAPTSAIGMLNEKLRIRKDLARFLIVRKTVKTEEQLKEEVRVKGIIEGRKSIKKATAEVAAPAEVVKKPRRSSKKTAEVKAVTETIDTQIDKLLDSDVKL